MQAAWERLSLALGELITSAPIKQRLLMAFENHLEELNAETLPLPVRQEFAELVSRLTHVVPGRGETRVNATVRKMSNQDAEACCALILHMLVSLHREALVSAGPAADVVPLRVAER